MKDKPTSIRLPNKTIEDIDNICDGIGCSRNEWIKDTLREGIRTENSQDQEPKPVEPEKIKVTVLPEPREFRCEKGNLLENDIVVGDCADYGIDNGKVFQNGIQIGIIKPSNLMTNVVVEN